MFLGVNAGSFTLAAGESKKLATLGMNGRFVRMSASGGVCSFITNALYPTGFYETGGQFAISDTNNKLCIIGDASGAYIKNNNSGAETISYFTA